MAEPIVGLHCPENDPMSVPKDVRHAIQEVRQPAIFFEAMSKRRKGFPSETKVKRGVRIVHGNKHLEENLGRNDLCLCGSRKRFKKCCMKTGYF